MPASKASRSAEAPSIFFLSEWWLGAMMGIWISLYPYIQFALHPRVGVTGDISVPPVDTPLIVRLLAVLVVAGIVPAALGGLTYGLDFRRSKLLAAALFIYCLSIPISLLAANDLSALSYVVLIDYMLACIIIFTSANFSGEAVMKGLFLALVLNLALCLVVVLIDHDYAWGRLTGRMSSNYWGALAGTMLIATITIRRWIVKAPIICLALYVVYVAQSRSEMLALGFALPMSAILIARRPRRPMSLVWVLGVAGALAILVFGWNFILNDLMKFYDPARGVASGLTGRTDTWRDAIAIFLAHPWFGVGYQQHQIYMTGGLAIHSDYLATLADVGVFGFIGYIIFQLGGLVRALLRAWAAPTDINITVASYLTGFAAIGLVEPTGFHIGNTASMLMVLLSAWSWRVDPRLAEVSRPSVRGAYWKAAPAPGE